MRKTIQNIGLLVIVLALSAVFLLEFGGPQSRGCTDGGAKFAAKVYGDTITLGEMKAAYILAGGPRYSTQAARDMKLKEHVITGLVERDLLAREAEELGFEVTQDDVMLRLAKDGVLHVSAPVNAPSSLPSGRLPIDLSDEDGNFSPEIARRFIQNRLGRTVEEFAKSQIRETLAQRMREVVVAPVVVSPSEAWEAFVREREQVTLKYVRFEPAFYAESEQPSAEQLESFKQAKQADIKAEYEREKHRYTGLEKQVRARHILIKVDAEASEDDKASARQRAEAARKRALAGESFEELARTLSEDTGSARQGGDLGYNTRGKMVTPFDDAQFALEPGKISELVETRFGFHVIKVEGVREGDVPLEEAEAEIAEKLYEKERSAELAKQAALDTLKALKAGQKVEALEASLERDKEAHGDAALAPVVKETRPFGKGGRPISGADNNALVRAAFELSEDAPLAAEPVQVGDSWVVFRLEKRDHATREDFEGAEQERLMQALLSRKRDEVLASYVTRLRESAEREGHVRISTEAVQYSTSEETASL